MQAVLAKTGWKASQVDLYEVNEAFACVAMAAIHDLELDHARVNVNGGACALGHPIGATGARILTTLVHALKRRGRQARHGVAVHRRRRSDARVAIEMVYASRRRRLGRHFVEVRALRYDDFTPRSAYPAKCPRPRSRA